MKLAAWLTKQAVTCSGSALCTRAREVWIATGIPLDTHGVYYRDFIDFIWYLMFVPNFNWIAAGNV